MPETQFWRTMNPAKLTALYNAQFGAGERREPPQREKKPKQSLRDYMKGG